MTDRELMQQALEALKLIDEAMPFPVAKLTIKNLRERLAQPEQEPVAWKWHQATVKTSWGHEMVVADLAIDKDNTVSVYCERDQTAKVEAMFNPPAALAQSAERNKLAAWMQAQGYATGHGDTIEQLLEELRWQVEERGQDAP